MARLIRARRLSAREALVAHLKQIKRVNPKVNAIVTLMPEMAAQAAAKADEMQARNETLGPLHGLPVAHKDLFETRGIRTTFGSPLYKDYVPTEDDIVVERMRRARDSALRVDALDRLQRGQAGWNPLPQKESNDLTMPRLDLLAWDNEEGGSRL